MDNRTIEILSQVVYKELKLDERTGKEHINFWETHKEETLELARNILRVQKTINP